MAGVRFQLDLFIPQEVFDAIPPDQKAAIRSKLRELESRAVKINEGQPNEEMTVRAVWHICHHDEGTNHPPCGPEKEL